MKLSLLILLLLSPFVFAQTPPPTPTADQIVIQRKQASGPYWLYGVTPVANKVFGWDGTKVVMTSGGTGGSAVWGDITGTLSDQTDLQAALDALQPKAGVLALGGFSSITGTLPAANIADLSATYLTVATAGTTYVPLTRSVATQHSITGGGDLSANRTFNLVNDTASPGNSQYYGTNGSGTRGWFALPTSAVWGNITGTLSAQTDLQTALNAKQPLDGDLTAISALTGTNTIYYRSAVDTWTPVTIGSNLSFSGGTLNAVNNGTVTSVSVVTANGVSGSVATATTTPAITLTLGAITPSSVAASGNVTGLNLSGTNTGDQITITGNAGSATVLQTGRTIAITGDLTYTSPTFNGSSNVTAAGTLATVNSNVGTFGSAALIPVVTVNAKGLVTAVTTAAVPDSIVVVDTTAVTGGTIGNVFYHKTGNVVGELSSTTYGQGFLGLVDSSAARSYMGLGTLATLANLPTGLISYSAADRIAGSKSLGPLISPTEISVSSPLSLSAGILSLPDNSLANVKLINSSVTVNGTSISLGASGTVTAAAGTLTGTTLASNVVSSSLTSVGTITTGVWNGTAIANANLANSSITIGGASTSLGGTVTATTILDSIGSTRGSILERGASGWAAITPGTSGHVLTSNGAGADPSYQAPAGGAPGGSSGQFQYNNAGAFGGTSILNLDSSNGRILVNTSTTRAAKLVVEASSTGDDPLILRDSASGQNARFYFSAALGTGPDLHIAANRLYFDGFQVFASSLLATDGTLELATNQHLYGYFVSEFTVQTNFANTVIFHGGAMMDTTVRPYAGQTLQLSPGGDPVNIGGDLRVTKTVTTAGTTGAQTINKTSGSVNFAAAATSLVVTNSLVTANSIIICTVATNDTTMTSVQAVAASGSFTIYSNAPATAETRVNFIITN